MYYLYSSTTRWQMQTMFENLVDYDKSETYQRRQWVRDQFENLVNYNKSKTISAYREMMGEYLFTIVGRLLHFNRNEAVLLRKTGRSAPQYEDYRWCFRKW